MVTAFFVGLAAGLCIGVVLVWRYYAKMKAAQAALDAAVKAKPPTA